MTLLPSSARLPNSITISTHPHTCKSQKHHSLLHLYLTYQKNISSIMNGGIKFQSSSLDIILTPTELLAREDGCRTPTSRESKIPMLQSCPPAPRKRRRVISCKRNLSETQFFEIVHRKEIESFFNSFNSSRKRLPVNQEPSTMV